LEINQGYTTMHRSTNHQDIYYVFRLASPFKD